MFTYPYQILKLRLQTQVTELREVDWYLEQDSIKDKRSSIKALPSAYIEFFPVNMIDEGNRMQSSIGEFNVHLVTENMFDTDQRMKKDQPIDHMRIFDKVFQNLHGFSSLISYLPEFVALKDTEADMKMFNSISRIGITPPHQFQKSLMKSVQRFRAKFYDHAATPTYAPASPPPEITTEVEL